MSGAARKPLYKSGNMDSVGREFAGVKGKTVESIRAFICEDDQPRVYIQFADNTGLEITIASKPDLSAGWMREENGNVEPFERAVFE